jgi:hypothetical protein
VLGVLRVLGVLGMSRVLFPLLEVSVDTSLPTRSAFDEVAKIVGKGTSQGEALVVWSNIHGVDPDCPAVAMLALDPATKSGSEKKTLSGTT